ncbi:MAG: YggT family protein [Dehalococcoidia bacterium]|nr:YggT family protein [Dehalococcoidia bacterium]MDW8120432.1 YggT family protein [Chloroflexota bacterium]
MKTILADFIFYLTTALYVAILVRAILSWFPIGGNNPIVAVIYQITEPILAPIRRVVPRLGFIDLSPLVAILLLVLIQQMARVLLS